MKVERSSILASMFCLGFAATLLQVIFMREMLVSVFGNEISIGVILGNWLICIALGAFAACPVVNCFKSLAHARSLFSGLLLVPALSGPLQVYAIRCLRSILDVPVGEYAPLGSIATGSFVIFFPACFCIGFCFPLACRILEFMEQSEDSGRPGAVSLVYTLEALGSMAGGVVITLVLLRYLTPLRLVVLASSVAVIGAILATPYRWARLVMVTVSAVALVAILSPGMMEGIEDRYVQRRWSSFGVISEHVEDGWPQLELVSSEDSIYQNLAVIECGGQYTLYGNGDVIFTFPDPVAYEHEVHFAMAQKPAAERVLLLGGNPLGDIPELLKYPLDRLVYVELDSMVGQMLKAIMPDRYREVMADPRLECVEGDAARYVKKCGEVFDVILVNAPQPSTAALNRFYTVEFYSDLKRLLSSSGFVACSVNSSERLRSEAVQLGGAVYQSLAEVFEVVIVTAESRNRFFAGYGESGLTFDRQTLFERSKASGITTSFFRPELFLGTDDITPEKIDIVRDRFTSQSGLVNKMLMPVAYFYNLLLWSRFSGSALESVLRFVGGPNMSRIMVSGTIAAALVVLLTGILLARTSRNSALRGVWQRFTIGTVIATTGFCGMALEVVLVFVFQGLFGYVYTRMGLIVAAFMLGLVLGAPSGRRMASGTARSSWLALAAVDVFLLVLPLLISALVSLEVPKGSLAWMIAEGLVYMAVAVTGFAVGAEFPLANRAFLETGSKGSFGAAVTDASDHLGAASGCILMGVVLVPVVGIPGACLILAAIKGVSLVCLGSAAIAGR